jgi:hypothetical protein
VRALFFLDAGLREAWGEGDRDEDREEELEEEEAMELSAA